MPFRSIDDPTRLRRMLEAVLLLEADFELPALLRHIVEEARSMTGASFGALGVLNSERTGLSEFVTVGLTQQAEHRIGARPKGLGVLGLLISDPRPLRLSRLGEHPDSFGFPPGHPPMTSFLGVPVLMRGEVFGNLYLTDKVGWSEFTLDDEHIASGLAVAAGIAIENAHLHQQVQDAAVLADRDRLARDFHDKVIQRLFGSGLVLQSAVAGASPDVALKVQGVIDQLDATIHEIRNVIFELADSNEASGLRSRVLLVLGELEPTLPFRVSASFDGPVDTAVSTDVAEHLLAVLREAVTNVSRHANATTASVEVAVRDGMCELVVRDNGPGASVDENTTGHGLKNMRSRADDLGGRVALTSRQGDGTTLVWQVPLQFA
jgi:signal transduction histidine kinase